MQIGLLPDGTLPNWLPDAMRVYLAHIEKGISLRKLAQKLGAHPSTVMRQVRRCEAMREDPLVDEVLAHLGERPILTERGDHIVMTAAFRADGNSAIVSKSVTEPLPDAATLEREAIRVLRRLAEAGAVLAIASDMEKAVVIGPQAEGAVTAAKTVVARNVVQAFAVKEWISRRSSGRIATYEITPAGRTALRRLIDAADLARQSHHAGLAEAAMPFLGAQHRQLRAADLDSDESARRIRYNLAESPIALLGRRRDKDGQPFIDPAMVQAAERLREDFELAQMGREMAQAGDRLLTAADFAAPDPVDMGTRNPSPAAVTALRARARVAAALTDLGPGLEDVAVRVCCYLEGIEATEKRMRWAARSGKVVLRIALDRLVRHYARSYGESERMIG